MAERIDIIVQAAQGASPLARGGGQSVGGVGGLPSAQGLGQVGQAAKQAQGGIEGMAQGVLGLQSALQGLAVVGVAQQIYGMGVAAGQAYLQLEKTEKTAQLLSGTTRGYNDLVSLARQNQGLFGGSLAENIQGLSGFANMARKSGIELAAFNDLASRLNLLSPEQGMEGAAMALKEAMSGDTQSLRERFELDRTALAGLSEAGLSAADRVKILNDILTDQGVAAGAAASAVSDTAKAYNLLGAGADAAKTGIGKLAAEGFAPTARGAGLALQGVADFIAQLQGAPSALQQAQKGLAENSTSYEEYVRKIGEARAAGEAQTAEIANRFGALSGMVGLIADMANSNEVLSRSDWEAARAAAEKGNAQAAAANQGAQATSLLTEEQRKQLSAQDANAESALRLEQAQIAIATIGGQVRAGAITAAEGVALLGADFGFAADEAARLLRNATAATGAASVAEGRSERTTGAKDANDVRVALAEKAANAEAALSRQRLATGGASQVIAERQRLLNAAVRQYGKDSAEAIDAATALQQAQESAASKGASAAESAAKKAQREREQRAEEVARAYERIEERTQDHYRRLRTAQEDYELSSSRKAEDYQIERQRLLAEGRIKEAQLLKDKFDLDQRRAAEDAARSRARTTEDYSGDVAKIRKDAQLGGAAPTAPTGAQAAVPAPRAPSLPVPGAPTLAASGAGVLRLEFGTLQLTLNGERVADVLFQPLAERLDAALAASIRIVGVVSPPGGGQGGGVSGSRP